MKKNEIKPGVIYAYRRGRSIYDSPEPVVFLTAPADGILYQQASDFRGPKAAKYVRAREGSKPQAGGGFNGRPIGYAAVRASWNSNTNPLDLLKPALAEFKTTTEGRAAEGVYFTLVTSLTHIIGLYDEVMTETRAREDAERQQRQREQAEREAVQARADSVQAEMGRLGVKSSFTRGYINLTVDAAENLLTLLSSDATRT
jgi:hypothetical protein